MSDTSLPIKTRPASRRHRLEEDLEHITQEMYKRNKELSETNRTLLLLRRIDEIVLGSAKGDVVVAQAIADLLVHESDFALAVIYGTNKEKSSVNIQGVAHAGNQSAADLVDKYLNRISLHPRHTGAMQEAVASGNPQLVSGFGALHSTIDLKVSNLLKEKFGIQSIFICPLRSASGILGVMVLGNPQPRDDIGQYQKLLAERLAGAVSISIENTLLYGELKEVTSRLRLQNKKLKELDQTKDEFISMASHQLRTPLTTIKGYLSMVLDGDVGRVKKDQQQMIQHAFDSAQRMVYLISDLLNVSRLQTGKFVIENKPTDLAEVIEGEVVQLKEQAASRRILLSYDKPSGVPILNLDETKIRQVIMNFLDNALYYTPVDGEVTVNLKVSADSVSFTVTDNGMGVPKAVQHHLFSKFYRADNARKMRPDGTGLGLYMARKVIVAQGGAIVFKSTEGKGSTFGFTFPRKSHEIKS